MYGILSYAIPYSIRVWIESLSRPSRDIPPGKIISVSVSVGAPPLCSSAHTRINEENLPYYLNSEDNGIILIRISPHRVCDREARSSPGRERILCCCSAAPAQFMGTALADI